MKQIDMYSVSCYSDNESFKRNNLFLKTIGTMKFGIYFVLIGFLVGFYFLFVDDQFTILFNVIVAIWFLAVLIIMFALVNFCMKFGKIVRKFDFAEDITNHLEEVIR